MTVHARHGRRNGQAVGEEAPAATDETLVSHPLLRVDTPAGDGNVWTVSCLGSRKGVRVPGLGVAALVLAGTPVGRDVLAGELESRGADAATVRQVIEQLEQRELLLTPSALADAPARATAEEMAAWRGTGWRAAAAYHFQTYGYEFETYEADGSSNEDARRMHGFALAEADVDRAKPAPPGAVPAMDLPEPAAGFAPAGLRDIMAGKVADRPLTSSALAELLSMVALPVGEARLPWPGTAPVLRKTSPSGGSRHPTECYVRIVDVPGLEPGWYHVAVTDRQLVPVRALGAEDEQLSTFFSGLVAHADFEPRAVLVYACMFRRNRYRYREPRTFRTVHMDVGHLMGTAQAVAAASGLAAAHLTVIRGRALAEHLGFDPLVECPLAATLLGSHADGKDISE